jgi:glycosyltransferase involved in cell wall biosynthesis
MGDRVAAHVTRIAIVVNEAKFFVSHRLVLAKAARDAGYEVVVITPGGDGQAEILAAGFEWHELRMSRGGRSPLRELHAVWQLYRLYRRLRPDLVHHVAMKPIVYGTLVARLAGVPAVVNAVSGMGYMFTGGSRLRAAFGALLYRVALRHPGLTLILQNSDDLATFRRWLPGVDIVLVPGSGVDIERFHPPRLPPADPCVLFTGRMLRHKGVGELIAAAARVRARCPAARFVLVGRADPDNPSAIPVADLERAAEAGDIEWLGERKDIDALLRTASVFCLPSYREGLSKSLLEAAATGVALVTTDAPGCREVVQHERNGLLVPVGDAQALADAVLRLLGDAPLRARLGAAARADATAHYAESAIIDAQLAIYRRRGARVPGR